MADRNQNAEDRWLHAVFEAAPIDDGGFSSRVLRRVRQRLWLRRLALPAAMLIGGSIAVKPALQLVRVAGKLAHSLPLEVTSAPEMLLPRLPLLLFGAALLAIVMLTVHMLEE